MKKNTFIALLYILGAFFSLHANEVKTSESSLNWYTNYELATAAAKEQTKPLFLYFTGSDWCGWCMKMDEEVLTSSDFIHLVGNKFIFVKIDFPIYAKLDEIQTKQNEELREKYKVKTYPTIILLDQNLKEFERLNYRKGGGKSYAEYLIKLLNKHEQFEKNSSEVKRLSLAKLQEFYQEALCKSRNDLAKDILALALTKNQNSLFFLKEQYHNLIHEGKMHDQEAKNLKYRLLRLDPQNVASIHRDIAVLDFEAYAEHLKGLKTANSVVQPLQDYLGAFGNSDPNRWRMEMTISQVFRSKQQIKEALDYAKASFLHAPEDMKEPIAQNVIILEQHYEAITKVD